MAHAVHTKIWSKIISTRAPNAATKPKTLEKSSYSPQSQKLTRREQFLETPASAVWYGQTRRTRKQPGGRYKSVKEFIFPQTSAET